MAKTVAYLRTSTLKDNTGQTTDTQKVQILSAGYNIDKFYIDEGVSGGVIALERKAFIEMMEELEEGTTLVVVEVSRIGRNVADVIKMTDLFIERKIKLIVLQFGSLDLTSSIGVALLQMSSVFSALERSMTKTRVKAGLQRAKSQGTILGKPSKVSASMLKDILSRLRNNESKTSIARHYELSLKTILNYEKIYLNKPEKVVEYEQMYKKHMEQIKINKLKEK